MILVAKLIKLIVEALFRFSYLIVGVLLIASITYLFGHHLLIGGLKGSDAAFAYHNASWYGRWWPQIPIWYPIQGGGFSLTLSYAVVPSLLAVFVDQITSFNLNQTMRLLLLGSYFVASSGIYVFCAWRLKNQTVGLMAAVFYLILPVIWYWSMTIGLFAFVITLSFVPWVFAFFDYWLVTFFKGNAYKVIFSLFLASLSFGLAVMFHIMIGTSLAIGLLVYGMVRGWTLAKNVFSISSVLKGFLATGLAMTIGLMLVSFWSLPFLYYNTIANRDKLAADPIELLLKAGITSPFQFPWVMTVFSIIGLILALVLRKRVLASAVVAFFFMFWRGIPAILPVTLLNKLQLLFSVSYRSVLLTYIFLPVVSAYGIWVLASIIVRTPFLPLKLLKGRIGGVINKITCALSVFLTVFLSLAIFIAGVVLFEGEAEDKNKRYGPVDPFIAKEQEEEGFGGYYFRPSEKNQPLPMTITNLDKVYAGNFLKDQIGAQIEVDSSGTVSESHAQRLMGLMPPLDQFTRVGWTGYEGLGLQSFGNYTQASTLAQYMYKGSLFHAMRGLVEKAFFDHKNPSQTPNSISNLASWVGYKYVLLKPGQDNDSHYSLPDWVIHKDQGAVRIYEFLNHQGLVTVSKRPTVLVIGKFLDAYDAVFRASVAGLLPYSSAWLVEGKEKVDDYSLEELKEFDGLILYGYSYKRRSRAFSLLDEYVKNGGKLFIDTGWQFVSKDWQLDQAPEVFPVNRLEWSTEISPGEYRVGNGEQVAKLGLAKIPFEWNGKPRGFSKATGLKTWAKPLLTTQGTPLMAGGNYGQGQVIWSGMNLFGYLSYEQYDEQLVTMASSVFDDLFPVYQEENLNPISVSRDYPDRVEITLRPLPQGGRLLWREADSPQWRVSLADKQGQRLIHYRAGPGFLLIPLPQTNQPTTLILEYRLGWSGVVGKVVTGFTLFLFLFLLIAPKKIASLITNRAASTKAQLSRHWEKEE